MVEAKLIATGLSAGISAASKAIPHGRKILEERKAGQNPYGVPTDLAESIFDDALRRLGVISDNDPLWKKMLALGESEITRPEMFHKPTVIEWLSKSEVRTALKSLAKSRIFSDTFDENEYQYVIEQYSIATGENIQYAKSIVETAITVLKVSFEHSPSDIGTAAFIQSSTKKLHKQMETLREDFSSAQSINTALVSEHHGEDVKRLLESIKLRRIYTETDTLSELTELVRDIEHGRYVGAPPNIIADVYYWLARVAAANKNIDLAHNARERLLVITSGFDTTIIDAWLEVANGNTDAALRLLRDESDAESRTVLFSILLHQKSDFVALELLDVLDLNDRTLFNPIGWREVVACLVRANRFDDAFCILNNMTEEYFRNCPLLLYLKGVITACYLVAEPFRELIIKESFSELREHLLTGIDIDEKRNKCRESFELAKQFTLPAGAKKVSEAIENWLIFLRLANMETRETEIARIVELMKDGCEAVKLIHFAFDFGINFNPEPLESYLMRQEKIGGLNPNQQVAMMFLYRATNEFSKLSTYITDHWESLVENIDEASLAILLIQSLCADGKCEYAEEMFEKHRLKFAPSNLPRLELVISDCRGDDSAAKAIDIYRQSCDNMDLLNVVRSLSAKKRWHELRPYAVELFHVEPTTDNANRCIKCLHETDATAEETLEFLAQCANLLETNDNLKSAKAWVLFHLGKINDARILNNALLETRHDVNDISLDLYITLRSGEWDKFPAIIHREWDQRKKFPAFLQFNLAKLATGTSADLAQQLACELVEQYPTDPSILLQAYSILITISRDDLAMPLIHRAAELSKVDGPVKKFSTSEVVEIFRTQADAWQNKNKMFKEGKVPLHFAATMFNIPLSRLLIAIPKQNEEEIDARKHIPVPIRSGARKPIDLSGVSRIILDTTTIMILNEIDCLDEVISAFDEISVSPRVMEFLHFEIEKIKFHQPSRVKEVRPLLEQFHAKRIVSLGSDTKGPRQLIDEVGDELAALLEAAKQSGGVCVHTGPLYKVSSFMEQLADIGDYTKILVGPDVVATVLFDEGHLSQEHFIKALEYLNCVAGIVNKKSAEDIDLCAEKTDVELTLPPKVPLYLDTLSAQYLSHTEIITAIRKSGRSIIVFPSSVDEWEALASTGSYTDAITESLEKIRKSLVSGMASSKIILLKEGHWDEDKESGFGLMEMPLIDILEDISCADAVCIDDRCFNVESRFVDKKRRNVPLACTLDLLDLMENRNVISVKKRQTSIHKMRTWGFFALPISSNELTSLLATRKLEENGMLRESAELRAIRENLACLHAADVLTTPGDLNYLDHLWQSGLEAIRSLWAEENSDLGLTRAKADWVVEHVMPDIELALRHAPDRDKHLDTLAATRLMVMLLPPNVNDERRASWLEWVENKVINGYLPSNPQVVDHASKQIANLIAQNIGEGVNELRKSRGVVGNPDATGDDKEKTAGR